MTTETKQVMQQRILLVVVGLLFLSCRPPEAGGNNSIQSNECENVTMSLRELRSAGDPATYAREHGLTYRDGKALVVIELKDVDQVLPGGYDVDQLSKQGNLVQAFVRVEQLCALATESQVSRIRPPTIPQPAS